MMTNAFRFILKVHFVLEILTLLSSLLSYVENGLKRAYSFSFLLPIVHCMMCDKVFKIDQVKFVEDSL